MVLEWDDWEEQILRLDVQDALQTLTEREQQLVNALLETGSLYKAARQLGMKQKEAQQLWEAVQKQLREKLSEYG